MTNYSPNNQKRHMEKNQKIELRHRTLPSGNQSLYLEFYEKGGKRRYESLKLYLIPEKDENDRRVNENTLKHALKLKSERVLGIEHPQETGERNFRQRRSPISWTSTRYISGTSNGHPIHTRR